jgi:hypothetical protein
MKDETFERSLRAFTQRRPFKPFLVELASGSRFTVDHPEAIAQRGPALACASCAGTFKSNRHHTCRGSSGFAARLDFLKTRNGTHGRSRSCSRVTRVEGRLEVNPVVRLDRKRAQLQQARHRGAFQLGSCRLAAPPDLARFDANARQPRIAGPAVKLYDLLPGG